MTDFEGKFYHTLDKRKNVSRISIPSEFRNDFNGKIVFHMPRNEKCLYAYTVEEWQMIKQKTAEIYEGTDTIMMTRMLSATSETKEIDNQGRTTIPQDFCEHALLTDTVFILGATRRLELWNSELWAQTYESNLKELMDKAILYT